MTPIERIQSPDLARFDKPAPVNPILKACDFLLWSQDKRDEERKSLFDKPGYFTRSFER